MDSGADRTIIPEFIADYLSLPKGRKAITLGIGGESSATESIVSLCFIDKFDETETATGIPCYILKEIKDIVIGRSKVFDLYLVTFDKSKNKILLKSEKRRTAN